MQAVLNKMKVVQEKLLEAEKQYNESTIGPGSDAFLAVFFNQLVLKHTKELEELKKQLG